MTNYTQSTNFATKDALTSGDPLKIVKGTEINTEFANIVIAVATKADLASPTFTGTPAAPTASSGTSTTQIATTAFVAAALQTAYPVGSIYLSTVSTNPNTLFGFGTWTNFGAGRMLISQNATYTAGSTGGSATSSLEVANLPNHAHPNYITDPGHSHSFSADQQVSPGSLYGGGPVGETRTNSSVAATTGITLTNGFTGNGTSFATISPYIAVYMWQRTA
jgi:hypothetical protein